MSRQTSAAAPAIRATAPDISPADAPDIRQAEARAAPAARAISAPLARFGARTASFTSQALGAEWSCFYFIDKEGQPFEFQVHRTPWALRESYVRHNIERNDPTTVCRLVAQNVRFISVLDQRLSCGLEVRRKYWNFLASFGTRDAAEMIFRVRGRAVAGMSLLWVGRRGGQKSDRQMGEAVQSYVEHNLAAHYGPLPADLAPEVTAEFALTERELEIVELVCHGLTNARIAQRLSIGLATVKTHLLHVFEKLGVGSRAELVSRCLSSLPTGGGGRASPSG